MSEQSPPPEYPGRRFSVGRLSFWCLGGLFALVVVLFAPKQADTSPELDAILSRLDETDPGWRLEEIEAARVSVPDERNSALVCREVARALGPRWPGTNVFDDMSQIALPELLDEGKMKLLEAELHRLEPIRRTARPLADMPRGRYPGQYALNPYSTSQSERQELRKVAILLRKEMLYLANKGDVTEAVRSGRAGICAGRALYDDPLYFAQSVRIWIVPFSLESVERVLSLGESAEAELVALDELMADEEKHETFLAYMRGSRAMAYLLASRLISGEVTDESLRHEGFYAPEQSGFERSLTDTRKQARQQMPMMMELMTRWVENARLPSHQQLPGEKEIEQDVESKKSYALVDLIVPKTNTFAETFRRKTALVSTMRGLIAAERYRMKHGKWPATLAEVVPEFLKAAPTDPFDGTPLKVVRVADGIIVYSVGADGVDDGGKLDRKYSPEPGSDLGFRLWDVAKRRRPPSRPNTEEKQP